MVAGLAAALIVVFTLDPFAGNVPSGQQASPPDVELGRLDTSGGMVRANLTLTNRNSLQIHSAEINCAVLSRDGSERARFRFTIFESVPAKGSKLITKHNFGPWPPTANSITCESDKALRG